MRGNWVGTTQRGRAPYTARFCGSDSTSYASDTALNWKTKESETTRERATTAGAPSSRPPSSSQPGACPVTGRVSTVRRGGARVAAATRKRLRFRKAELPSPAALRFRTRARAELRHTRRGALRGAQAVSSDMLGKRPRQALTPRRAATHRVPFHRQLVVCLRTACQQERRSGCDSECRGRSGAPSSGRSRSRPSLRPARHSSPDLGRKP